MTVSVVIPCLDRWNLTEKCLDALYANTDGVEVILIDNGGDETCIEAPDRVEVYVKNRTNQGFARSCNQGASLATCEYLVFLNNDTEVQPDWLPPLVSALQLHDVAGPKLVYPDGGIQSFGVKVDFSRPPGGEAWNIQEEWTGGAVDAVTGACLATHREKFAGFDEGYWNGYEDVDYCQGRRCAVMGNSIVMHHESASDRLVRFGKARENIARLRGRWS